MSPRPALTRTRSRSRTPLRAEAGFLADRGQTPGLLHAAALNDPESRVGTVRILEVGTTFRLARAPISSEIRKAGKRAVCMWRISAQGWWSERRALDVLDAKERSWSRCWTRPRERPGSWSLAEAPDGPFHPGKRSAPSGSAVDGSHAGVLGEIHPRVAEAFDITGRASRWGSSVPRLRGGRPRSVCPGRRPSALPAGPPGSRLHRGGRDAARRARGAASCRRRPPRLKLSLDVYVGIRSFRRTKSLAFSLDLGAPDRTLRERGGPGSRRLGSSRSSRAGVRREAAGGSLPARVSAADWDSGTHAARVPPGLPLRR